MGYSVMVEFEDKETRDKMLKCLEIGFDCVADIVGDDVNYARGPVPDPAYSKEDAEQEGRLIGFDFSLSDMKHARIAYLLCYFMAKKVKNTKIWYDGDELINIPDECDEVGFHTLARLEHLMLKRAKGIRKATLKLCYNSLIKEMEESDEAVRLKLHQLSGIWDDWTCQNDDKSKV